MASGMNGQVKVVVSATHLISSPADSTKADTPR
jgi:hypothetical protein